MTSVISSNIIYTIGYGNRNMTDFIALLRRYHVDYVVDVRSAPYSGYNTEFSKADLAEQLKNGQVGYIFMGDQLGGKPKQAEYFTGDHVDYAKLEQADFYRAGIDRLKVALQKNYRIVLMCAELKPETCHRSKLIGQTLGSESINVQHIDETGELKSQADVMKLLTGNQENLFETTFTSVKKYRNREP